MIVKSVQNLINSHKSDRRRTEIERTQPAIKVSKAVSFMAVLYERVRNSIDLEEEHLLRKRAIKRIMLRMTTLKGGDVEDLAANITREIIWAQYLNEFPVPNSKLKIISQIILKYQSLVRTYRNVNGRKIKSDIANLLYGISAFEIDRVLVPHNHKDALVNAMFNFIKDKGVLSATNIPTEKQSIQTYIAIHRAVIKSDNENIAFHLFYNKFPQWSHPVKEDVRNIALNFDNTMSTIIKNINYKLGKSIRKEIMRQSIPFKILDKVIVENLNNIEPVLSDENEINEKVHIVTDQEYTENKRRLSTAIIRSIIYLFVTKVFLALIIEVPYELAFVGHINFTTLGINIFFPITMMFIVANSFSIPNDQNTKVLQQMIKAILTPDLEDDKRAFVGTTNRSSSFKTIFKAIYSFMFLSIFGIILTVLYFLKFNIVGMFIFIIFFSTVFFFAARLRNTATELNVLNTNPSIFSPILDMFATPLLLLGKKLSEGASQLNFMVIIFDFLVEAPFKTIIKVFEEWNSFIRETREEIV